MYVPIFLLHFFTPFPPLKHLLKKLHPISRKKRVKLLILAPPDCIHLLKRLITYLILCFFPCNSLSSKRTDTSSLPPAPTLHYIIITSSINSFSFFIKWRDTL